MSDIVDEPCPECRSNGHDKTGNHLIIFSNGNKHCNRCGYGVNSGKQIEVEEDINVTDISSIKTLPSATLKDRHLNKSTLEHYGVKVSMSGSTGEIDSHYYPITKASKVTGYKVRDLPKKMYTQGDSKGAVELFGQKVTPSGGKKLVITEGELDALSVYQMLLKKYPQYPPSVVSLPFGDKAQAVADNLEFVNSFQEVLIYTDMDDAGKKCAEDIAKLVGAKAKVITTTEKDASDMLVGGKSQEFINAFFNAKSFTPVGVVEGGIGKDALRKPLEKGVYVDVLPKTMEKLRGFRKSEMTIVLAPAGVGKTTISKEIGYALNKAGKKIEHIFLEEKLQKTQQSYIAMDNNVHLARYREDPTIVGEEAFDKSYSKLVENQLYINHWGSISPDEIMSHLRYGASWGAEFAILDHVSMVFSGSDNTNERKEIDKLLTDMAAFTNESDMHLIVISHITRKNRPFRKSDDYPYWETVASDAGRGSGAFEQLAHNIITLEVEYLDEDMNKGRIRTRVAKNREWSTLGVGDVLTYSMETGRISPEKQRAFGGDY